MLKHFLTSCFLFSGGGVGSWAHFLCLKWGVAMGCCNSSRVILVNWIQCSFLVVQVIWTRLVTADSFEWTYQLLWQMPSLQCLGQNPAFWLLHPKCCLVSAVSFRHGCLFQWSCTFIVAIGASIASCNYDQFCCLFRKRIYHLEQ